MRPVISVVIPVFDERENLDALISRLHPVIDSITDGSFEVLFVDDGSEDGSGELLDRLNERDGRYKVIHFSRNFGHQSALQAGLDAADGSAVVLMDADMQDPPEMLTQFIQKWRAGYQVVYAIRRKRKESIWKRLAYNTFYRTMKFIAEIDIPLDAGDFCLMDRRVSQVLSKLPERNRFLRGLRSWVGFKQIGIEYERNPRSKGTPKYTLSKLIGLALSGYVGFSAFPLRIATWLGFVTAAAGFALSIWAFIEKLIAQASPQGWTSTVAIILFIGGVQLIILGIIGEYLGRVYDEVRRRPIYVISSTAGFSGKERLAATDRVEVIGDGD
jgi:glycosyltransferase involved in cell wall biosynthesis